MLQSVRRSGFVGRVAIIKTSTTAASTTPAMLLLLLLLGQISALPTRRFARIANSVTPYWRPWSTPYVPSRLMTSGDATSRQDRGSSRTSSYMYQSGVGSYSAAGRTRAMWVAVERLRGGADAGIKSEEWIAEKARLANSEGDGGRVGGDVGEKVRLQDGQASVVHLHTDMTTGVVSSTCRSDWVHMYLAQDCWCAHLIVSRAWFGSVFDAYSYWYCYCSWWWRWWS